MILQYLALLTVMNHYSLVICQKVVISKPPSVIVNEVALSDHWKCYSPLLIAVLSHEPVSSLYWW